MALATSMVSARAHAGPPEWSPDSIARPEVEFVAKQGEAQRARLQRGMRQVLERWTTEDGDAAAFAATERALEAVG